MRKGILRAPSDDRLEIGYTNTRRGRIIKNIKKNYVLYLFLLPTLIWYALFCYLPMSGIYVAFTRYKGAGSIFDAKFVGLKWFKSFFGSEYASMTIGNTLRLSLYYLAAFPLPVMMAILLNEIRQARVKKAAQTIMYAPHFVSLVVMVSMVEMFFSTNGIVNIMIEKFGGTPINFLASPSVYPHLYVWSGVWTSLGWDTIIYTAALSGVDPGLHEAATLDGASRIQRIIHINLPTILPTIVITLILRVGNILNLSTEKSILMRNDMNMAASETIGTFVYSRGLLGGDFGYAAAVGLFLNIVSLVLMLTVNAISQKVTDNGLF